MYCHHILSKIDKRYTQSKIRVKERRQKNDRGKLDRTGESEDVREKEGAREKKREKESVQVNILSS